jgi:hypothetical protein
MEGLEQEFVVDERGGAVGGAAGFAVAAFGVEVAGAAGQIVGIETDSVGGPGVGDADHVGEHGATEATALAAGGDGHGEEIERSRAFGEIFEVDGPGFFGGQGERADDDATVTDDVDARVAEGMEDAFLGDGGCPRAGAEVAGERFVGGEAESGDGGGVGSGRELEGDLHGGLTSQYGRISDRSRGGGPSQSVLKSSVVVGRPNGYNKVVKLDRQVITKSALREHTDDNYAPGTMEERVLMVWPITREVASLNPQHDVERRLQRHVVRVGRRER